MALKLKGSTSGFVGLDAPSVAGNNTLILPENAGSAHQILANDITAGVTTFTQVTVSRNGDLTVPGTISIGGTLTYEDVTSVDSVGIVTARGLSIFGNTTGLNAGISTFTGDVTVSNNLPQIYLTDTNSSNARARINANGGNLLLGADNEGVAADSIIYFEVDGSEKLRITSAGQVLVGLTTVANTQMVIYGDGTSDNKPAILFQNNSTATGSSQGFYVGSNSGADLKGYLWNYENDSIVFGTNNAERMHITSAGKVSVNHSATSGMAPLSVKNSDDSNINVFEVYNDNGNNSGGFSQASTGDGTIFAKKNDGTLSAFFRSNGISYLTGGSFGVGTDSPNRTLSVKSNGGQFSIIDDDDSKGQFYCNAGTVSMWATGGSSIAGSLDFATTPNGGSTTSRLQISAAGDVTVNTGNLVIGTAGKGIDFSAQTATSATGASASAEILDHYEEGSWTPSFGNLEAGTTYSTQYGRYCRNGSLVQLVGQISASGGGLGSDGSAVNIQGLPFVGNSAAEVCSFTFGRYTSIIPDAKLDSFNNVRFGGNYVMLHEGSNTDISYAECNSSGTIQFHIAYIINT